MCGISGFYSINKKFDKQDLVKMTNAISHRGPDAKGFFYQESIGLGHRRLSILDLSESANQPMTSHCGRYVMAYNGEVYNFQEIATELKSKYGINFKTSSDTEVLLEAFAHWNTEFVNKLNGMFAIAIYDKESRAFYLFRDRMGIKPIYYYWNGADFAFASELKAIKQLKHKIDFVINPAAINSFLHLGYIPEPHSIYQKTYKFPAGHYLKIEHTNFTITNYWKLETKIKKEVITDYSVAKQGLKDLIENSVRYRMISDVPFGTFLSGGIDSSIVTAVAQKYSDAPINTFSIGFNEAKHNEAGFAKNVADYLKTNHHEFIVSEKEAIELADKLQIIYDEPFADSSAIPTLLVSKLARQHVTMTLSGDGGDELFLGYGSYQWAKRLSNPVIHSLRKPIAFGLSNLSDRYQRIGHLFKYKNQSTKKSHIFSQEQYLFSRDEIKDLIKPDFYAEINLEENYSALNRKLSTEEEQAFFDLKHYLKDDLLVKVDRATMQHSLETRVPLLDYRIVEFALNLSPDLKLNNGLQKFLLKEVLYDYLPKELFDRPKWGFSVPLKQWLKTDLRFLIDEYLSEKTVLKHNIVNYKQVAYLKKQFLENNVDHLYNRIWLLIILHQWLENN